MNRDQPSIPQEQPEVPAMRTLRQGDSRRVAAELAALSLELHAAEDRAQTLQEIVNASVATVPGATGAGIALIEGRKVTTAAPTGLTSSRMHQIQVELDEGPCITSLRDEHTVVVDDLAHDTRWPRFAAQAVELGVRATLSFQLYARGDNLGALDLYALTPDVFDEDAVLIGELFAHHASIALSSAGRIHHLSHALASRDVIGQAKGILMQRDRLDAQQAFDLLVRTSQHTNLKLVEVARWLVEETEQHAIGPGSARGEAGRRDAGAP